MVLASVFGTPPKVLPRPGDDRPVTVCSACLCASCWQGVFLCDQARVASTREMTIGQLRELDLENPSYWVEARQ